LGLFAGSVWTTCWYSASDSCVVFCESTSKATSSESRYLVKDFGTSQSPKSTRLRDSLWCPGTPCGRYWTRQTHAEPNTAHKWLYGVSDVLADFLRGYGKHPPSPLRKYARTYAYRGLPAFASLSLAGSDSARPHQGLGQRIPAAGSRSVPKGGGKVVPIPILGGLHHDYQWAA